MKRGEKARAKQKEQKVPKSKWEQEMDQSIKNGALGTTEEFEKETALSIADPVIPRWVTTTGAVWYACGECDKEVSSKDWTSHWKKADHKGKEKHGTVPCIDVLLKTPCERSINDFKESNSDPKLAKFRMRRLRDDPVLKGM
jgi:hypothetical protein